MDGIDSDFAMSIERLVDGMDDAASRDAISAALVADSAAGKAYVGQLRVDALLREHFQAVKVTSRTRLGAMSRLALTAASLTIIAAPLAWFLHERAPDRPYISVAEVQTTAMTQEELDLCKARYASDRSFEPVHDCSVVKYEPGSIPNPGAAIRVLEAPSTSLDMLLHAGDRVWRSELSVETGRMSFSLADDTVVTMVGPAVVKIHDERTVEIVKGSVLADAKRPVAIIGSGLRVAVAEASVGAVANGDGVVDLLVTDGLVMLDRETCLRPGDGIRHRAGASDIRYRRIGDACGIRNALLTGVTDIRIERIRHAL